LITLEDAMSYIPPRITYSPHGTFSKNTTKGTYSKRFKPGQSRLNVYDTNFRAKDKTESLLLLGSPTVLKAYVVFTQLAKD
ncbi:4310_t:CDS:2, partial [Ambispora leptoticha]